jgi:AraC-like DNA-binding protein
MSGNGAGRPVSSVPTASLSHKKTLHVACNGRDAGIFHGIPPAQYFHEGAGECHRLIVMPEIKSEARIDWQDEKDGGSGTITLHGQHVVFIHKQVSYILHWKQEAMLLCFCAKDEASQWRPSAKKKPLDKVQHSSLWALVRYDCGIMDITRLFVEFSHGRKPAYPAAYFRHLGATLSFHLLDGLTRERKTTPAPTMDEERLHRVLDYIDKNLHGRIRTQTLASTACLSTSHFKRLFKASTGMTANDYIFRRRMRLAQTLLRQGGMKIVDVAALAGFCDQSHLDRCFRRFCQCSPRDFLPKGRIVLKNGLDIQ